MIKAAFGEVDITPDPGIIKIGWLKELVSTEVLDHLYARVAVFADDTSRLGFVQLDTLSIRWTQTNDIRRRIEAACGFPGDNIMVSATHNHAGPAVANVGECKRDETYIEELVTRVVEAFVDAVERLQNASVGFSHVFNFDLEYNRRTVMRDGTVKTHLSLTDLNALYVEGPIDPEMATIAVRRENGELMGVIVNYACHPTHDGGSGVLSAGYPGALAAEMKRRDCPVTLFLNGACGNTHYGNPVTGETPGTAEMGSRLADDTEACIAAMKFTDRIALCATKTTVDLPYRDATEEQTTGTVKGAQRFIDTKIYDAGMSALLKRIEERGIQPAEVQVLSIGNVSVVGVPAEYFVEHGLRIKEATWPRRTLISSCTNGMVGYLPTRHAFDRGGYETTFAGSSRHAPEAGDMIADAAIDLICGIDSVDSSL